LKGSEILKIGLFYEDKNTGELFMCDNFTYSFYIWINSKGESIEEDKWEAWKHINNTACKDKVKIKNFLDHLNYNIDGICYKCKKVYSSKFKNYKNEISQGEMEICPICGDTIRY
jgi:hypothetical protein